MLDNPGGISFLEFAKAVQSGPLSKDKKERGRFYFKMYDVDRDGEISPLDLIEL